VKVFSSRRAWIAAAVILLLMFLLRPGASPLKSRIIASISSGLGRSVDIGSVRLRLLPRPGFDLANLVVYDDPAFGAEPMLRAGEVVAALRLVSLFRGRVEISRLELTEPSLNLVRAENGRWNVESLLERTARTPMAPTAKAKSGPRPGFPYIEASSARINFKSGPEKKPYALTNADFSLWQESENTWGVRLKGQPVRSDLNLNDMGVVQASGTWQRAATFRDTPLEFNLEWDRAQLGQLTKFLTGSDLGWRGGMQFQLRLTGTPAALEISNDVSIQDLRRYDISSGEPLHLAAHCDGKYAAADQMFHSIMCSAPVGNGMVTLTGDAGVPGTHRYGLALIAEKVPASAALPLAQRAKKGLPDDLIANGLIRGSLTIDRRAASKVRLDGQGEIADFQLASAENKAEIGPETIPFMFTGGDDTGPGRARIHKAASAMRSTAGPHVEFGPFPVAIGHTSAVARGWANGSAYAITLAGDADIAKTLRVSRLFGVPALNTTAEGSAQIDLKIAGEWRGWSYSTRTDFPGVQVTGTAKLHNVRVPVRGAAGAVEISSAEMQFASDEVRVERLKASGANTSWTGSLRMPRGCGTPSACEVQFSLTGDHIALGELAEWASPRPKERPWYRVLETTAQAAPSVLGSLHASGRVTTDRLQLHGLTANRVSARVSVDRANVQISDLNLDFLGGKHHGDWRADFSSKPAVCSGSGSVSGIMLGLLRDKIQDRAVAGNASASYRISGPCTAEFWNSAEGTAAFDVGDGVLSRISLGANEGPLAITHMAGQARLQGGKIELKDARLDSPSGTFQLSGTASLRQELNFKLQRNPAIGFAITGTLAEPRVAPLGQTEQARLKTVVEK
jgi:AsmA-like C-terminal region/AsmA family